VVASRADSNDATTATSTTVVATSAPTTVAPQTIAPTSLPEPNRIVVQGNIPLTDTDVELRIGDVVSISATGAVSPGGEPPYPPSGPDGVPEERLRQFNVVGLPDANHGALIGRIGETGKPFLIGSSHRFDVTDAGRLFLGINDMYVQDETGEFLVLVAVTAGAASQSTTT
jgi:hypothetical protein